MLHIPILRQGRPYKSLQVARVPHHRSEEPFVEVSQANGGLIRRDLLQQGAMRAALAKYSCDELVAICESAADHFLGGTLAIGDEEQGPEDYVRQTSATTGLPHVLVRRNMKKVHGVLGQVGTVLAGLTRGLDLGVLDRGEGVVDGRAVSFFPRGDTLGVVLPSNSPGVHSLWVPAVALKTALVLKPGSAEPWTPYRIIQALIRAGAPEQAFGFYPSDHASAAEILRGTGRGMLFGDTGTLKRWEKDPRIELHGPGYSKVVLGPDAARDWEKHIDVIVESILQNSGRSCVNASSVWVAGPAAALAEALAERLAKVTPRSADDPEAELAPFARKEVAHSISTRIEMALEQEGAVDLSREHREDRVVEWEGSTYLLPTITKCAPDHPLARAEYLFPFAAVVEVDAAQLPECLGPSLAVTALTEDPGLTRRLLATPLIHRLNLGPIPTMQISWDQPHEGNLFEHLWGRRAFQREGSAA